MDHADRITQRRTLAGRTRPRLLRTVLRQLRSWYERDRQRRQLRSLDARMRRDIGVTREEALRESRKPFWRD